MEDAGEVLSLGEDDSLPHELSGEKAAAMVIMDRIMKHWGISDPYAEMRKGYWNDPGRWVNLEPIIT